MKIMMFAHGGSLNRGCEAIVRSSSKLIKEGMSNTSIMLASDRPHTDTDIHTVDVVFDGSRSSLKKYSLHWFVAALQYKLFGQDSYALGVIESNIINRIHETDVCLSIGGDNYCYGETPNWYEIDRRIKNKGKKLVLWGCSIGEEDMSEQKLADLKRFDLIIARESLTYDNLLKHGLRNVKLSADPAFTMEQSKLPLPAGWREGNTIGINFSPLVWKMNEQSRDAVKELVSHIIDKTDMTIAFTPHVIYDGNNDYEVLQQYYEEFKDTGRVVLLPDNLNATEYKGYIARMRMFIGARTHATIAAYSNLVPTMVLGYSVKSKGIAKDIFGEEKLVLGLEQLSDSSLLIERFDELLREEDDIRRRLSEAIPHIQQMSHKAVDYLKQLA